MVFSFFGLMFFVAMPLRSRIEAAGVPFPSAIGACLVIALVFALLVRGKLFIADEVDDCGDSLLIRQKGIEERVSFSDIAEVRDKTRIKWPPQVVITFHTPNRLGSWVAFCPAGGYKLSGGNPIAADLAARVKQARP